MRKANLMLHCGSQRVERDQLNKVQLPERTRSYVPIAHGDLLDGVQTTLERSGLTIIEEAHGMSPDGGLYFGLLQVMNGHQPDDFGLVIGLRNSHTKKFPAGIVVGSSVFVCDNLSFSGEVRLARKHTVNVERDLPQLIESAIGKLGELRRTQDERFLAYKNYEFTDIEAHDFVIRSYDAGILPVTYIPDVLRQWREPVHPEFAPRTGWSLFNGYTECLKGRLEELPRRSQALHGLMDSACGLVIQGTASEVQVANAV